jgi:hypothetical protein
MDQVRQALTGHRAAPQLLAYQHAQPAELGALPPPGLLEPISCLLQRPDRVHAAGSSQERGRCVNEGRKIAVSDGQDRHSALLVFRATDYGASWVRLSSGPHSASIATFLQPTVVHGSERTLLSACHRMGCPQARLCVLFAPRATEQPQHVDEAGFSNDAG